MVRRVALFLCLFTGLTLAGISATVGSAAAQSLDEIRSTLGGADGNARRRAVESLGRLGGEEVVPLIAQAYRSERQDSFGVRAACAAALGDTGLPQAVPVLEEMLADTDYWVRGRAARALGKIPGEEATRALLEAYRDRDERVREQALLALGGREGGDQVVREGLRSEDERVVAAALTALEAAHGEGASAEFRAALNHPAWRVRYRAAALLAKSGDPDGARLLADAVRFGDHAGAALRETGCLGEDAVPLLAELAIDRSVEDHDKVMAVLEELDCPSSTEFFVVLATSSRGGLEDRVRAAMVLFDRQEALGRDQLQRIARLVEESDANLVGVALQILAERGGAEHLPRIAPLVQHENKVVRHFSLANLARYGGAEYEAVFVQALEDPNGANVRMALEALAEHGSPASLAAIRPLVEDRKLRRYAAAAVEAIEGRGR